MSSHDLAVLNAEQEAEARLHPRRCCVRDEDILGGKHAQTLRCDEVLDLIESAKYDNTPIIRLRCAFHGWLSWVDTRPKDSE